jgi:chromosome segregation ATPase
MLIAPPVMIAPRSAAPKRAKQPPAVRIGYRSPRRAAGPAPAFRSSHPGGEPREAETLMEEAAHLRDEIAQLSADLRPLREGLRNLMDAFDVRAPKLDGSSAPRILTRELEGARESFDRACAREADLASQFSIDAAAALRKTVAEQRRLFDAMARSVEGLEQALVEAEAETESRGLRARRKKFESGSRTQRDLRNELAQLRERECRMRNAEAEGGSEIEKLTQELRVLRRYKERQLERVRCLRTGERPGLGGCAGESDEIVDEPEGEKG